MMILDGFKEQIYTMAFSPDGLLVAAGGGSRTVRVWDAVAGSPAREIATGRRFTNMLTFDPTGQSLITYGEDGIIWRRDLDGRPARVAHPEGERAVLAMEFTPDGDLRILRYGGEGRGVSPRAKTGILLIDEGRDEPTAFLTGYDLSDGAFARGGGLIALGTEGPRVLLWDTGASRARIDLPRGGPLRKGFRLTEVPAAYRRSRAGIRRPSELAFAPDGARVFALYRSRAILAWDVADGRGRVVVDDRSLSLRSLAVSPSGTMLATAAEDGHVRVFDLDGRRLAALDFDGQAGARCPRGVGGLFRVAFSPDGTRLAAGGLGAVAIWDLDH